MTLRAVSRWARTHRAKDSGSRAESSSHPNHERFGNFWREGYPKIKKELQRKYPKHEWR